MVPGDSASQGFWAIVNTVCYSWSTKLTTAVAWVFRAASLLSLRCSPRSRARSEISFLRNRLDLHFPVSDAKQTHQIYDKLCITGTKVLLPLVTGRPHSMHIFNRVFEWKRGRWELFRRKVDEARGDHVAWVSNSRERWELHHPSHRRWKSYKPLNWCGSVWSTEER